jgi:hypothetical protein
MYRRLFIGLLFLIGWAPRAGAQSSTNVYVFPLFADGTAGGNSYRSTLKIVLQRRYRLLLSCLHC